MKKTLIAPPPPKKLAKSRPSSAFKYTKCALLISSALIALSANAAITFPGSQRPEAGKHYDDFVIFDRGWQINSYPTEEQHYYFDKGAQIGGTNGGTGNAVNIGIGDTPNVYFHIGKAENSEYDLTLVGRDTGIELSSGAQLHIEGEDANIKFGPEHWDSYGDAATIYIDEGANLTIDAGNVWTTGGAETNLKLFDNATATINLSGDFISDAGGTGIANQNFYANSQTHLKINAQNIRLSTTDLESAQRKAGLYLLAYGDAGSSTMEVNLSARDTLEISGFKRGVQTFGSSDISLSGKDVLISALSEDGYGFYLQGYNAEKSTTIKVSAENEARIVGVKRGIYATDRVNIEGISGKTVNILGGEYGVSLSKSSSIVASAQEALTVSADDGWAVSLATGASAEFHAKSATFNGDIYASDSGFTSFANATAVNGQVRVLDGSSALFASADQDDAGTVTIKSTELDALTATSDATEVSKIDIRQQAYINSQGDEAYHADKQGIRTHSAIRAHRNSEIALYKAGNIYGDVIAGQGVEDSQLPGGKVLIATTDSAVLKGDYFAGNGGSVDLTLNGRSSFEGRIDDYADATLTNDVVFRPGEFDIPVTTGGTVNLTLNDSATWTARGQSFVSTLAFGESGKGVVDLTKEAANSVTVREVSGNGVFNMRLNAADHTKSDMLYIGTNHGVQTVNIVNGIEGGFESITEDNPLRFATVGNDVADDPNVEIDAPVRAFTRDAGVWNLEYVVQKEDFDPSDAENEKYNGSGNGEGYDKPGNDFVENVLAQGGDNPVNWIITGVKDPGGENPGGEDPISDAGETIIAAARATYWNSVILDRWNQRYGDRVYDPRANGVFARVKHERIGTDDGVGDFRSYNTMYQVGYDYTRFTDNGRMIWGGAFDYMDGRTDLKSINGDGGTDRLEGTFYATYIGDSGYYGDLVLRVGRLDNDFQLTTPTTGQKLDADYKNWLYGLSFETGVKLENDTKWWLEPQVQMQYMRIEDENYRTQQTTVDMEAIDSLITRAGFRMGRTLSDDKVSNVYFKADVLHEWLGEQKIRVSDVTTPASGSTFTIDNKGTYFDVGAGFQFKATKSFVTYGDLEYRFGEDLEKTWIFNVGGKFLF